MFELLSFLKVVLMNNTVVMISIMPISVLKATQIDSFLRTVMR